jgi:hypothetical protein
MFGVPQRKVELDCLRGQQEQHKFIKSPPLEWMMEAAKLPGKALAVGLAIWYLSGCKGTKADLRLTSKLLGRFGVATRRAKSGALAALEGAGLLSVTREPRRNPLVTIREARKGPSSPVETPGCPSTASGPSCS